MFKLLKVSFLAQEVIKHEFKVDYKVKDVDSRELVKK